MDAPSNAVALVRVVPLVSALISHIRAQLENAIRSAQRTMTSSASASGMSSSSAAFFSAGGAGKGGVRPHDERDAQRRKQLLLAIHGSAAAIAKLLAILRWASRGPEDTEMSSASGVVSVREASASGAAGAGADNYENMGASARLSAAAAILVSKLTAEALRPIAAADHLFFSTHALAANRRPALALRPAIDILCSGPVDPSFFGLPVLNKQGVDKEFQFCSLGLDVPLALPAQRLPRAIGNRAADDVLVQLYHQQERLRALRYDTDESAAVGSIIVTAELERWNRVVRLRAIEELAAVASSVLPSDPSLLPASIFSTAFIEDGRIVVQVTGEFKCVLSLVCLDATRSIDAVENYVWRADDVQILVGNGILDAEQTVFASTQIRNLLQHRITSLSDGNEPAGTTFREVYILCHTVAGCLRLQLMHTSILALLRTGHPASHGIRCKLIPVGIASEEHELGQTVLELEFGCWLESGQPDIGRDPAVTLAVVQGSKDLEVRCSAWYLAAAGIDSEDEARAGSTHDYLDSRFAEEIRHLAEIMDCEALLSYLTSRLVQRKLHVLNRALLDACPSNQIVLVETGNDPHVFVKFRLASRFDKSDDLPVSGLRIVVSSKDGRVKMSICPATLLSRCDAVAVGSNPCDAECRTKNGASVLLLREIRKPLKALQESLDNIPVGLAASDEVLRRLLPNLQSVEGQLFLLGLCDVVEACNWYIGNNPRHLEWSEHLRETARPKPNLLFFSNNFIVGGVGDNQPAVNVAVRAADGVGRGNASGSSSSVLHSLCVGAFLNIQEATCTFELLTLRRSELTSRRLLGVAELQGGGIFCSNEPANQRRRFKGSEPICGTILSTAAAVFERAQRSELHACLHLSLEFSKSRFTQVDEIVEGRKRRHGFFDETETGDLVVAVEALDFLPVRLRQVRFSVDQLARSWEVALLLTEPALFAGAPLERSQTNVRLSDDGHIILGYHVGAAGASTLKNSRFLAPFQSVSPLVQFQFDLEQIQSCAILLAQFRKWAASSASNADNLSVVLFRDAWSDIAVHLSSWSVDHFDLKIILDPASSGSDAAVFAHLRISVRLQVPTDPQTVVYPSDTSGLHVSAVDDTHDLTTRLLQRFRSQLELLFTPPQVFVDQPNQDGFRLPHHDALQSFALFVSRVIRIMEAEHVVPSSPEVFGVPQQDEAVPFVGSLVIRSPWWFRFIFARWPAAIARSIPSDHPTATIYIDVVFDEKPADMLIVTDGASSSARSSNARILLLHERVLAAVKRVRATSSVPPPLSITGVTAIASAIGHARRVYLLHMLASTFRHLNSVKGQVIPKDPAIQAVSPDQNLIRCEVELPTGLHACFDANDGDLATDAPDLLISVWRKGAHFSAVEFHDSSALRAIFRHWFFPSALMQHVQIDRAASDSFVLFAVCSLLLLPEKQLVEMTEFVKSTLSSASRFVIVMADCDFGRMSASACKIAVQIFVLKVKIIFKWHWTSEGSAAVELLNVLGYEDEDSSWTENVDLRRTVAASFEGAHATGARDLQAILSRLIDNLTGTVGEIPTPASDGAPAVTGDTPMMTTGNSPWHSGGDLTTATGEPRHLIDLS